MHANAASGGALHAVATGTLPVVPGDMVVFKLTRSMVLVATATGQQKHPTETVHAVGQRIVGVVTRCNTCYVVDAVWLDWSGYGHYWYTVRP